MTPRKILFLDRDGTLIEEPADEQIDSLEKFRLIPNVIPALRQLQNAGYSLVMVSNQDGLDTASFPREKFEAPQQLLLHIFTSQGISFEAIRICPHRKSDFCECRKPKLGLILDYLRDQVIDRELSYVIGDRKTDLQLAENLGIRGIRLGEKGFENWNDITRLILSTPRRAAIKRTTKETHIEIELNLDEPNPISIQTDIGFFDHMLEQLAKHGGFSLKIFAKGDLYIDEHHTIEDVAIALGEAFYKALGDKYGIARYGFLLPMDEALAQTAIDLCGRSYFTFNGKFERTHVGEFATELIPHFFRSFAESLKASLHIDVKGENNHHMIEAIFKAVGRTLKQAIALTNECSIPSTKGQL